MTWAEGTGRGSPMTTTSTTVRTYEDGWADAMAALMVSANVAIERCEATAASFAKERGIAAETGDRLMTAAAVQIRTIVANVQAAQTGAKP